MTGYNCARCGKELTDAASREVGCGPVCRGLDNALLAKSIPADLTSARTEFAKFSLNGVDPSVVPTLVEVETTLTEGTNDWRATVKRVEWTLSRLPYGAHRTTLTNVVRFLGYVGLAACWNGECAKGEASFRFENGRLFLKGPNNKAGRTAFKALPGRRFHPETKEWSVPAKEHAGFAKVILTHWPNHSADDLDSKCVEAAKTAELAPVLPTTPEVEYSVTELPTGWLRVKTPYNGAFVAELKALFYKARKWNPVDKAWDVKVEHKTFVTNLCEKFFGTEWEKTHHAELSEVA